MRSLFFIVFFAVTGVALGGCGVNRPFSTNANHQLSPRPVAIEGSERCPALSQAIIKQLNQRDIEVGDGADTVLELTCATRPSGISIIFPSTDGEEWSYEGDYPLVSEAMIFAYNRDGERLAFAGTIIAHERDEDMSKTLAKLTLTELFGRK